MALPQSRRTFLTTLAGGAVVGVAGAGGTYGVLSASRATDQREPSSEPSPSGVPPAEPAPIVLTISSGADPTGARQILVDLWNAGDPRVQVRIDPVNLSASDQYGRIKANALKADILNIDAPWVARFAQDGLIRPAEMDPSDAATFLPKPLSTCRVATAGQPEALWALPFNTDAGLLFVRRRDEPPAIPGTLVELLKHRIGDRPTTLVGQLDPQTDGSNESFIVNVLEHVLARDPAILGDNGMPTSYDTARWLAALTPLRTAWQERGRIVRAADEDDSVRKFTSSRADCMRNWPLRYFDLDDDAERGPRSAYLALQPLQPSILGGQNLAVTQRTPHAGPAHEVVAFLTGPQAQKILAAHGFAPTQTAVYSDPHLKKVMPHLATVRQAVDSARPRPIHRNYPDLPAVVRKHVQPFLNGAALTDEFTRAMQEILR